MGKIRGMLEVSLFGATVIAAKASTYMAAKKLPIGGSYMAYCTALKQFVVHNFEKWVKPIRT